MKWRIQQTIVFAYVTFKSTSSLAVYERTVVIATDSLVRTKEMIIAGEESVFEQSIEWQHTPVLAIHGLGSGTVIPFDDMSLSSIL